MKLSIPFSQFKSIIEGHVKAGKIHQVIPINEEQGLLEAKQTLKDWKENCIQSLAYGFGNMNNEFINEFKNVGSNQYRFPGMRTDFEFRKEQHQQLFKSCIEDLNDIVRMLSICDPVVEGEHYDSKGRDNLSTEQKMFFLLNKLNQVNDGRTYPVDWILKENEIRLNHPDEAREIVKEMESFGLIKIGPGNGGGLNAGITFTGQRALEEIISNRSKERESKPSNVIQVTNMYNSVIQQGSTESSQNVTITPADLNELKLFLKELKYTLDTLNISIEDRQELDSEIITTQIQVDSPKPKLGRIKETLKTILSILDKVDAPEKVIKLFERGKQLYEMIMRGN